MGNPILKYIENRQIEALNLCWSMPFNENHIIFSDYSNIMNNGRIGEIRQRVEEYERVKSVLDDFIEKNKHVRSLPGDNMEKEFQKEDIWDNLFTFYCLYIKDSESYNRKTSEKVKERLAKYEKEKNAAKTALKNCVSIRIVYRNNDFVECAIRRENRNWVKIHSFERDILEGLIKSSEIAELINMREGDTRYTAEHPVAWPRLKELIENALTQTQNSTLRNLGRDRNSFSQSFIKGLNPMYRFLHCELEMTRLKAADFIIKLLNLNTTNKFVLNYLGKR